MAKITNYGMGQYRFDKSFPYISKNPLPPDSSTTKSIDYYKGTYQDILIILPKDTDGNTPIVQYGKTYFVRLTVPQNNEYTARLNLKLCPAKVDSENKPVVNTERFQQIKTLVVPPSPQDDDIYNTVILYKVPKDDPSSPEEIRSCVMNDGIHDWGQDEEFISGIRNFPTDFQVGDVYQFYTRDTNNNKKTMYLYCKNVLPINRSGIDTSNYREYFSEITESSLPTLTQDWKLVNTNNSTVTFEFIFSPKYNLSGGYPYLLIETERTDTYQQTIQYVDNLKTYSGTRLKREDVKFELYSVSNLLEGGSSNLSAIQSGTDTLTHIALWGHPGLMFAINGEEIKVGQSGFYELKDFTIKTLGVVVKRLEIPSENSDGSSEYINDVNDRFTID